jgi:DinB superfamily
MNNNNTAIQNAINIWNSEQTRFNKVLDKISDEQLLLETVPNKNTGIYLLGHLMVIADAMIPLLGFGEAKHSHLLEAFVKMPDKSGQVFPPAAELRKMYVDAMATLNEAIKNLPLDEWLTKHNSVSAEDFAKEPHRNKLSVLMSRAMHQAYHGGQLAMLG